MNRFGCRFAASLLVTFGCLSTRVFAEELVEGLVNDVSEYWATEPDAKKTSEEDSMHQEAITPVQMLAPQRSPSMRTARNTRRGTATPQGGSDLSGVPFMIGDTGAGSCLSFGGLFDVDLAHPTMACSRLNISENNTPLPTDRLFFSYRHFHNATPTRVFQFSEDFSLDRFTLGGERTFLDRMMSLEIRLPLEGRLSSDVSTRVRDDIPVFDPLAGGRRGELGNVSGVLKALLSEGKDYAISAGIGVTLPTAQDVTYSADLLTTLTFPSLPGVTADTDVLLEMTAANETVYLSPFLAWLYQPQSRFFHQGFMQVEVAANPSSIMVAGDGLNDFYLNNVFEGTLDWGIQPFPAARAELFAQTLLRLNLGCGYVLSENQQADFIQKLTALAELHYTSTLQDANTSSVPVEVQGSLGTFPVQSIDFGNRNNRVDILNLVLGLSANVGNLVVTNGIAVPIREERSDRGFDFEYNLQVQRPY